MVIGDNVFWRECGNQQQQTAASAEA